MGLACGQIHPNVWVRAESRGSRSPLTCGDGFSSSPPLLPYLPCGDPPFDIEPGGHGYMADLPPGFVITRERVDAFIRTL